MILYFPINKVEIKFFLIALSKLNCTSQKEFDKEKVIKETFYPSFLSHIMFTWTLRKRYQLLIFGLIFALRINSCYSKDRGCSDIGGLANRIKNFEGGSGNTSEHNLILYHEKHSEIRSWTLMI